MFLVKKHADMFTVSTLEMFTVYWMYRHAIPWVPSKDLHNAPDTKFPRKYLFITLYKRQTLNNSLQVTVGTSFKVQM